MFDVTVLGAQQVEALLDMPMALEAVEPVSYTHLDVYKRQTRIYAHALAQLSCLEE